MLTDSICGLVGLHLAATEPGRVRTLVAFEPPVTEVLPDRERWRAFFEDLHDTYRTQGLYPALGAFAEAAGLGGGEPPDPDPDPETAAASAWPPSAATWPASTPCCCSPSGPPCGWPSPAAASLPPASAPPPSWSPWPDPRLLQAPAAAVGSVSLPSLFWTFLKLGSVVFGSGYVLLAFLRDDLVEGLRVISDRQLVDAVAVGQITPGPVFTTATFIGYLAAGTPGAVVAAVALMAGVAAQLAGTALVDPLTVALAAATLAVLLRWHPNPTWLIAAGATVGLLHGWA